MTDKKRVKLNIVLGLIYQIFVFVCGLILPRLILLKYGSSVNGLVNSISNFLNIIALMEMGVGAVTQSALYKPLVNNDELAVSRICSATKKFYRIIGTIFIFFAIGVGIVLSTLNLEEFDFYFTFILVLSISITYFAQYYFGIVDSLLLRADQRSYILYIIQGSTLIINTIACYIMIQLNLSIQIVKLTTSAIYLLRPLLYHIYIKKNYNIIAVKPKGDELEQKWSGMFQHFVAFVILNTDIIVLTIFSSLVDVSIYSVYYMIAKALQDLMFSLMGGIKSYYGKLIALGDKQELKKFFDKSSLFITFINSIIFAIAICTILPFISVYTKGIEDGNYYQPLFAFILLLGKALSVFKCNFNYLVFSAGHYRETRICSIIEVILKISTSIILVIYLGLIGVVIGTLISTIFSLIYYWIYVEKKFIKHTKFSLILIIEFSVTIIFSVFLLNHFNFQINNYSEWVFFALIIGAIISFFHIALCCIFNFKTIKTFLVNLMYKKR